MDLIVRSHWICRAVPGRFTLRTQPNLGFQARCDQLPTLDPIVCSNWICQAVPGRFTLQTQPNLELATFLFSKVMPMFLSDSCYFHSMFICQFHAQLRHVSSQVIEYSSQVFRSIFHVLLIPNFMVYDYNQFKFCLFYPIVSPTYINVLRSQA